MARRIFRTGETDTGRVEAFSDGVLAIVITLLVLDIRVPHVVPGNDLILWQAIRDQVPIIGAWVVSFLFVLVFWVAHHYLFKKLGRVDRGLLWLNGLFLLAISFTPFPTALSGQYPATRPATFLLSAAMFVTAGLFSLMRLYVALHPELLEVADSRRAFASLRRGLISPCLYFLAVVASFVYPPISIVIQIIVPVIFIFPERQIDQASSS